ncbi:hypothetical protein [Streptomyces sp. NPDC018347]|uniref:hypothetical protein n=1 Tax=Streptomyces sp. NPDC018347 TaxID=3157193 RepID=UPI0033EF0C2E
MKPVPALVNPPVVFDGGLVRRTGTLRGPADLDGAYDAVFSLHAFGYRAEAGEAA